MNGSTYFAFIKLSKYFRNPCGAAHTRIKKSMMNKIWVYDVYVPFSFCIFLQKQEKSNSRTIYRPGASLKALRPRIRKNRKSKTKVRIHIIQTRSCTRGEGQCAFREEHLGDLKQAKKIKKQNKSICNSQNPTVTRKK